MAEAQNDVGRAFWMTLLFLVILALLPFAMDFFAKLTVAILGPGALGFIDRHAWLQGVASYLPVYLLILFYLKTTFKPLSAYGYTRNTQHLGLAVYIGIGSGLIMFLIDWMGGLGRFAVQAPNLLAIVGYTISWAVLPALTEETLFRGVIQTYYQTRLTRVFTRYKVHVAVVLAVAAELIFHVSVPIYYGVTHGGVAAAFLQTLPQLIYVVVFGFVSGVLYQRTGSLLGPMLIHGLGNLTELILIWSFR